MLSMEQVHIDYMENGADIITTASYQVSSECSKFVVSVFLLLIKAEPEVVVLLVMCIGYHSRF